MKHRIMMFSAGILTALCLAACGSAAPDSSTALTEVSVAESSVTDISEAESREAEEKEKTDESAGDLANTASVSDSGRTAENSSAQSVEDPPFEADPRAAEAVNGTSALSGLKAEKNYQFPVVLTSGQDPFWGKVREGMDQACRELGVTCEYPEAGEEDDIEGVVSSTAGLAEKNPPALGLAVDDPFAVSAILDSCTRQGVPVVLIEAAAGLSGREAACVISVDNAGAGSVAAEKMFGILQPVFRGNGRTARIGVVCPDASDAVRLRALGFMTCLIRNMHDMGKTVRIEGDPLFEEFAEGADEGDCDLVIEAVVAGTEDAAGCAAAASDILSRDDTVGIFGPGQTASEGILESDRKAGRLSAVPEDGKVIGVGFDSGAAVLDGIRSGQLYGAVTRTPYQIGYYAVLALTGAANGEELTDISADYYWYDRETMDQEPARQNLYE